MIGFPKGNPLDLFKKPEKPDIPEAATVEGDAAADEKAQEEASRRARAAAGDRARGGRASLIGASGGAGTPLGRRSTLGV